MVKVRVNTAVGIMMMGCRNYEDTFETNRNSGGDCDFRGLDESRSRDAWSDWSRGPVPLAHNDRDLVMMDCFHPTTYDLGNGQVQCVDCLKIWAIKPLKPHQYAIDPNCETCVMHGECVCMADFDHEEFRREMQPLKTREEVREEIDRVDRHLLTIPPEGRVAAIYRKLRDDLETELKRTESQ